MHLFTQHYFWRAPLRDERGAVPHPETTRGIHNHQQVPRSTTGVGPGVHKAREQGATAGKGPFKMVTPELSPERREGAHLVQGSFKAAGKEGGGTQDSRCGCQGGWTLSHKPHWELSRPTCKALHLYFQVTKIGCIKYVSWVMEKEKHVMKCYHTTPGLHSLTMKSSTSCSLPRALPALHPNSARVQGTTYMACFSLLNQKMSNQIGTEVHAIQQRWLSWYYSIVPHNHFDGLKITSICSMWPK